MHSNKERTITIVSAPKNEAKGNLVMTGKIVF